MPTITVTPDDDLAAKVASAPPNGTLRVNLVGDETHTPSMPVLLNRPVIIDGWGTAKVNAPGGGLDPVFICGGGLSVCPPEPFVLSGSSHLASFYDALTERFISGTQTDGWAGVRQLRLALDYTPSNAPTYAPVAGFCANDADPAPWLLCDRSMNGAWELRLGTDRGLAVVQWPYETGPIREVFVDLVSGQVVIKVGVLGGTQIPTNQVHVTNLVPGAKLLPSRHAPFTVGGRARLGNVSLARGVFRNLVVDVGPQWPNRMAVVTPGPRFSAFSHWSRLWKVQADNHIVEGVTIKGVEIQAGPATTAITVAAVWGSLLVQDVKTFGGIGFGIVPSLNSYPITLRDSIFRGDTKPLALHEGITNVRDCTIHCSQRSGPDLHCAESMFRDCIIPQPPPGVPVLFNVTNGGDLTSFRLQNVRVNAEDVSSPGFAVARLTPLSVGKLKGFADGCSVGTIPRMFTRGPDPLGVLATTERDCITGPLLAQDQQ